MMTDERSLKRHRRCISRVGTNSAHDMMTDERSLKPVTWPPMGVVTATRRTT